MSVSTSPSNPVTALLRTLALQEYNLEIMEDDALRVLEIVQLLEREAAFDPRRMISWLADRWD